MKGSLIWWKGGERTAHDKPESRPPIMMSKGHMAWTSITELCKMAAWREARGLRSRMHRVANTQVSVLHDPFLASTRFFLLASP